MIPLPIDFYDRPSALVARDLLGKLLSRETSEGLCVGRIVETEAYLSCDDEACHASRGKTKRNATMFGPPGRAYVYRIHQVFCLNAVTEPEGIASAVLIRAIEPLVGVEIMEERRGMKAIRKLARGPGRLCQAFAIDLQLDGWDLTQGTRLWIVDGRENESVEISVSTRIGISTAKELPLRFFVEGNAYVSGRRSAKDLGGTGSWLRGDPGLM